MKSVPNLTVVEDMAAEIDSEYDLGPRLERYKSLSPELLEFAAVNGLGEEDAPKALFISDYIVTSSEVPQGVSDDERRLSIIKAFIEGKKRNENTELLMRVFYLAQKIKQAFRRNDYFLAGRGLERNPSLVILKNLFIAPYLEVCKNILGDGEQTWELGVLYAAIKHTLPDEELRTVRDGMEYMWQQLQEYAQILDVEQNDTMTIPNISDTQVILLDRKNGTRISMTNVSKRAGSGEKKVMDAFLDYLDRKDSEKSLIYLNSSVLGGDQNIIMVRNPYVEGKPVVLMKTKADELNVSQVLSLLYLHSLDEWKSDEKRKFIWTDKVSGHEEVEVEKEITEIVEKEVEEVIEVEQQPQEAMEKKRGFFSRLFRRKGKSKKKKAHKKVKKKVPSKVKKKVKSKELRAVTKDVQKSEEIANVVPSFVTAALSTLALGDLNLFEIWDTVRDSDYVIVGAMESDFGGNITTLRIDDGMGEPEDFAGVLDGLDEVVEAMIKYYFDLDVDILPNDILFVTNDGDNDLNYYISFDGNEDRLMGTIAVTYRKKSIGFAKEEEEDRLVNRRTMKMRTRQLMSSREHTPFDTSVERILGESLSDKAQTVQLEKAILSLH